MDVRGTFGRAQDEKNENPETGETAGTERPPVVLVHGIGMSGEYFLPFAHTLATDHDVFALDLPGYGTTPTPPRALTVPELGEVLAQVIRALGLDGAVVVGHSMGCQIVVDTLARNPGLCAGYVLIGPTVDPAAHSLPALAWRLLRDSFGEPAANNAVVLRNYLRMGPLRYLRTARHMLADRIEEAIIRCEIPGLVVRGDRDPIAPHGWAVDLVRLAPDAGLVEIPDAPHAVQYNRPHDLAAACARFLKAVGR
ncbi:alpha/beta hydrolase [Citricoccus sp.]|uniref:alpha/beta fold hydrolase n=1 Tax=Citricoccus sp. TaxID=1978372 RepID=UPI0028BED973|nr:alpha/beta hydrolase [Citricoccus sp.]